MTESYCPSCGVFIAASPSPQFLKIAEDLHRCVPIAGDGPARIEFTWEPLLRDLQPDGQQDQGESSRRFSRLAQELARTEPMLMRWLQRSELNMRWFRKDPVAAIRAASLGLEEDILRELEDITSTLVRKLNPPGA